MTSLLTNQPRIYKGCIALFLSLTLAACGGGSDSGSSNSQQTPNDENTELAPDDTPPDTQPDEGDAYQVTINFFKGPVQGANCALFETVNGNKSQRLIQGTTGISGHVTFEDLTYQGLGLVECSGGTYQDEATEEMTSSPTPLMRSVVALSSDHSDGQTYMVTPLTEIAASLAENDASGFDSASSLADYHTKVATAFGLELESSITQTQPADLLKQVQASNSDAGEYAYAIALISAVVDLDESGRSLNDVMDELKQDLSTQLSQSQSLFSESKRAELGLAHNFFTSFGSLVNSALQATSIRRNINNAAQLIEPEAEPTKTHSVAQPIETIRAELIDYVTEHNLQPLAQAPVVTDAMYELGQALAFDKILSGNKDTSCLTCHHPLLASGDARALSLGTGGSGLGQNRVGGKIIARHAQPLFNLDLFGNLFWDGRVQLTEQGRLSTPADDSGDLTQAMEDVFFAQQDEQGFQGYGLVAAQAMFPVTDAHEMRGEASAGNELATFSEDDFAEIWSALMVRLGHIPEYVQLFEAAYPGLQFAEMTFAHAANAIAGFEIRAFNLRNNPWQQVIADISEDGAWDSSDIFDEDTTRGAHFFFDTGCVNCHKGSVMSDFDFHNLGNVQFGPGKGDGDSGYEDWGREHISGDESDRAKFRTAPLFNITLSAPYGHLGQMSDLWSHIQIYAIPERFWLNLYTGYDRIVGDFVHTPDFNNQVSEAEQALFKTIPVPSYDDNNYGFFRTVDYIDTQVVRTANDPGRLTMEEGKRLGDSELQLHRQILLPFMDAQTDPAALDLSHLIPDSVPSGLPVESHLMP